MVNAIREHVLFSHESNTCASVHKGLKTKKEDDVSYKCSFYTRSRSLAYVMDFRLPMSSSLWYFIHGLDTGHAEGISLAYIET